MRWILLFVLCQMVSLSSSASTPISSPWIAGDTWQGGSPGSYYHEPPYHVGSSEYAIDFNLKIDGAFSDDAGYPILAVQDGVVLFSGWKTGFGNTAEIDHGSSNSTFYAHFLDGAPIIVKEGEVVKQGQVIGFCGKSGGTSTGNHLHFEQRENGSSVEITSMDGYHYCDPSCDGHVLVSRNNGLLDQAYDRYGPDWIGYPEYQMWDLGE